jgi:MFS family permease
MGSDAAKPVKGAKDGRAVGRKDALVIGAASVGTVFEWYDFYLYGSLATYITKHFFSGVNETTGYIFALLAFAAGFAVRPFGALVFGRLGDLWGRKNTFLVTMLLMGLSTFVVGLLPSYASIGIAAPIALVVMRLVQGLALGGEYGGAATYVAEHAPPGRRGFYTSFIQVTATFGLFLSLVVILLTRNAVGDDAFQAFGWRIPFLISVLLLGVSLWIRLQLSESPSFQKMVDEGKGSKKPLADSFAKWGNLKIVLLALVGLTAGQAVVWYTGQFYALFFLEKMLKVDGGTTNLLVAIALLIGTPFFVFFGWLSDKIGRKPIIMLGCILAALTYFPLFKTLTTGGQSATGRGRGQRAGDRGGRPGRLLVPVRPRGQDGVQPLVRPGQVVPGQGRRHLFQPGRPGRLGGPGEDRPATLASFPGQTLDKAAFKARKTAWEKELGAALKTAGYPAKADPALINKPLVVGILAILVLYVTMVYGPIAAMLVELFPTNIRYTSMSLPYHIGNGWFGGFLPTTAFAMVAATGNIYYGLWYPIVVAAVTAVVGVLFLKETKDVDIEA